MTMEQPTKQYVNGFNSGYLLAKYMPNLLSKIVKNIDSANDYFVGFFSGKEELELENSRGHIDDLARLRDKSGDRD